MLALLAAPAHADVPAGWGGQDEHVGMDALHALGVLVGAPLLLFVLIALAVYLPAISRGEKLLPDHSPGEGQWIGGPRQGVAELPAADGDDSRAWATRLHNRLVAPARSVLVLVDPRRRVTEVVTGGDVRRHLTDGEVELAVLAMSSEFATGNVLAGLQRGLAMLAEHARPQQTLHA